MVTHNPTAAGPGGFLNEIDAAARHVRRAHELASTLLDQRHAKSTTSRLLSIALALRSATEALDHARELVRLGAPAPAPVALSARMPAVNPVALVQIIAAADNLPLHLRLVAQHTLDVYRAPGTPSAARELLGLSEWVELQLHLFGVSLREASRRASATDQWREIPPRRIRFAFQLHRIALKALRGRP